MTTMCLARVTGDNETTSASCPRPTAKSFELWLLEQGYRYGRAVEDRPELRRSDWKLAREYIARLTASQPVQVLAALDRRLRAKLGVDPLPSPALASAVIDSNRP